MDKPQQDALDFIWNEAALLMLRLDPDGIVREANDFARRYIGDQCIGRPFADMVVSFTANRNPAQLAEEGPGLINLNMAEGNPVTFRIGVLPEANGMLAIGSPDIEGLEKLQTQVLGLNHELNDLGRQLQKANAELHALNALKNQFLGMAAHDLRSPLGTISSFAEFLRDEAGPALTGEHTEYLDIILDTSKRMQKLIEDFLDVSMIEAGKLSLSREPIRAGAMIAGIRSMIDRAARAKGVVLEVAPNDPDPMLDVDESKIRQVLINLVRNSIEHSNPGGRIWISTHHAGNYLTFSVKDEGGGISQEQCKRIFSPFERAGTRKTSGERSIGLGLAIAKKIVDAHGGTIGVESQPGSGSVFFFTVPLR